MRTTIKQLTEADFEAMVEKQNAIRGFTVPPINKDELLERIKYKDWSAYLIGEAFLSMYRTGIKAEIDLMDVCNLDAQGKRLLFQSIFARDVPHWNCEFYWSIETEIKEILGVEYKDDKVVII